MVKYMAVTVVNLVVVGASLYLLVQILGKVILVRNQKMASSMWQKG